jgi:rRNA maturation endonuclease Nob1
MTNKCHSCGKVIPEDAGDLCDKCYENFMRSQEEEVYRDLERQEEYHRWLREDEE